MILETPVLEQTLPVPAYPEPERGGRPLVMPRQSRRLSDRIMMAFHQACDQADFEIAEQLLCVLSMVLHRRPVDPIVDRRRHDKETLVAAYERLWSLRHPFWTDVAEIAAENIDRD
jgi:hypothetical protein